MIDPITITTLVTVIFTSLTQVIQLYFDYKVNRKQGHDDVYKVYESNCCNTELQSD